ncbi:unnamed protein product [Staurois parvus]|uniref:Uncharacterized protein n=1 Tax=Staurois parvus TaxID=386267 RepID=A0ABN9EHD6_9NEOB|nr:unnamed protein product [Staurois parvus]
MFGLFHLYSKKKKTPSAIKYPHRKKSEFVWENGRKFNLGARPRNCQLKP